MSLKVEEDQVKVIKIIKKTNRQLGRAGRRRDRYRKMVELPAGGPAPRTNLREKPKRRIKKIKKNIKNLL